MVEIYHPPLLGQTDYWIAGAVASETRGYHSVALLMPDGRIWTGGSELEDITPPGLPLSADPKLAIEIYEPAYCSVSNRLQIAQAPSTISYKTAFAVSFIAPGSESPAISRIALMRFGSVTHSFDGDQRYIGVPFSRSLDVPTKGVFLLDVTAPPDGTVAPPGYYMLWLLDSNGVPCDRAALLRLGE